jgi:hypothetical protein
MINENLFNLCKMITYYGFERLFPELKKEILCYHYTDELRLVSKSWKKIIETIFIENGLQVSPSILQLNSYLKNVNLATIFCYVKPRDYAVSFNTDSISKFGLPLMLGFQGYKYEDIRFPDLNMRSNTTTFENFFPSKISLSYESEVRTPTILPTPQFISYILENHYLSANVQFIHKSIRLTMNTYYEFLKNICNTEFDVEHILKEYNEINTGSLPM